VIAEVIETLTTPPAATWQPQVGERVWVEGGKALGRVEVVDVRNQLARVRSANAETINLPWVFLTSAE